MSIHAADTPSSTTGSTAGSPPATLPPPTPHSPNTTNPMSLPSAIDIDNNSGTTNSAGNAAQPSNGTAPPKRKAGRRANTAERRATHNAVERQRRETLNGRFLDLAALLPNLATVRRPSKSAIVNSSIALIHSNRRQRLIAARELRLLKVETDALRRELNEWRDRSGLPRVDEPARAPEFLNLLSLGESELGGGADGSGENWWENAALDEMGEEERKAYELVMGASQEEDGEDGIEQGGEEDEYARGIVMMKNANNHQHAGALAAPGSVNLQHILPRGVPPQHMHNGMMQQHQHQHQQHQQHHHHAPAIASPTSIGFDPGHMGGHPAIHGGVNTMYEPNGHPHPHSHALPVHPNFMHAGDSDVEKVAAWNAQLYSALGNGGGGGISQAQWAHQLPAGPPQQQHHGNNGHVLFTPPGTAGSNASNEGHSPHQLAQAQAFLSNLHQQQQQQQQQRMHIPAIGHGHVYTSPERDDASSVGSVDGTSRSSGGSPQPVTVRSNYEVVSPGGGGAGVGYTRRPSLSLAVPSIVGGGAWNGQSPPGQPMSAGGRHYAPVAGVMI